MAYLQQNIITDSQYGFRQKRSADLQLLQTVHDLASLPLCLNEKARLTASYWTSVKHLTKFSTVIYY